MPRRLRLDFAQPEAFRAEYEQNIAKGGVLLPTEQPAELREAVEVELGLAFAGESLVLEGEVVHCAPAPGGSGGYAVAVQFVDPAPEVRDRLARHAEAAREGPAPGPAAEPAPWDDDPSALDLETDEEGSAGGGGGDDPLAGVEDRRAAPREPAHVAARVEAPTAELGGYTRDLSESGALVAVDGSAVPIGGRVRLALADPAGGKPLEVEGTVARHVEADGTVAAVAVRFDPEAVASERVGRFVEAAKRRERERLAGGIGGALEEIGVVNLLQMLGKSAPLGTFTASDGVEEALVAFEEGRLRYARLGPLRGTKALARLLSWKRGRFQFHASVDPLSEEDPSEALDGALLEALRQLDEAHRAGGGSPAPATRFRLDREALARSGTASKTEEAVCDLAAAGFTLRRILDVIPEPDAEVLKALAELEDRGVLSREGEGS